MRRDENTCREDLSIAELTELGRQLEALEKPTSRHTSVTDGSPVASSSRARSSRARIRIWCGVTPNTAWNCRMK